MYQPAADREDRPTYARSGRSGLVLSLGLWRSSGRGADSNRTRNAARCLRQRDNALDLASNYGPPPGSAETNFGSLLHDHLAPYRDELVIAAKAGYLMWDGPYGEWGSRKYVPASLDQSLRASPLCAWGAGRRSRIEEALAVPQTR